MPSLLSAPIAPKIASLVGVTIWYPHRTAGAVWPYAMPVRQRENTIHIIRRLP
ncbi:MAG: hypothetical protein JXM79_05900 [Sedimentisphaerales bacterium]|nr:hypothetical protein [Sedimentisphaerales bacterium]